eukprot:jgi/Tetstr1/423592/TSEL_014264.t1
MAVPAPPMSRATSSQHPATTASATADGAVAGGAPCQATMRRLVRRVRRRRRPWSRRLIGLRGCSRRARLRSRHPPRSHLAGHADLLVAMLTGALRAVAGGGHMPLSCACPGRTPVMRGLRPTDGLEWLLRRHPGFVRPQVPMHGDPSAGSPLPDTATVRAEFRHVRDAFHDATRAAVCEASEKARAAGRVRRVRRRTAQELKESETCRQ